MSPDESQWGQSGSPLTGDGRYYASLPPYNVTPDGITVSDAAITSGQNTLTSVSANFTGDDQGKLVVVIGAGAAGAHLYTTITQVRGGAATLAANAGTTVAGAEAFYGTDNTAGIQKCLNDSAASDGCAVFPWGDMAISATLNSGAGALAVQGQGVLELFQATGNNNNFPTVAPYLHGTVFVQCAPNTDILQQTPDDGLAQSVRDVGLRFAGRFTNTGNGLVSAPTTVTHMGNINGLYENVKVYGHDGNHYGFVFQSHMLTRYTGMRSYGGGGFDFFMAAGLVGGNYTAQDCYACVYIGGSAHGLFLDCGAAAAYQYASFHRCQTWVYAPTVQPAGTVAPTSAQFCLKTTNQSSHSGVGFTLGDFETNVGSKAQFPFGNKCYRTNDPSAAVDASNNVTTSPTNATGFQNVRGTGLTSVHTFVLQPLAAASASTTLSAASGALATTITVTSATGFAAGQGIQVDTGSSMEFAIIKSIAGNVLTLISPSGFGLLLAHASGATVAAGAAVAIGQTNVSNTWDGARWEILAQAIGQSARHSNLAFPIASGSWGRLDWANATRAGSNNQLTLS